MMPFFKDLPFKQKKTRSVTNRIQCNTELKDPLKKYNSSSIAEVSSSPKSRNVSRSCSYADEETVLINSVAREDVSSVRRVLENGKVDVNAIRHPGFASIHHACVNGNLVIVKLLLRFEADINIKSKDGTTPLKLAATHGHFDLAEYLIAMGATENDIIDGV